MPTNGSASSASSRYASPSRQVLTIFGDYWWHVEEQIPSAALVAALGDLGVADGAARATLSRLTRAGVLEVGRSGRRTSYRLTPRGSTILEAQNGWLETFGAKEDAWNGEWSVVAFSVPEAQRALRHQARNRLRWLGYAPLHDGLWISPGANESVAMAELEGLGAARVTALRATSLETMPGGPEEAWNLADVAAVYDGFLEVLDAPLPTDPAAALADRTRSILEWQSFRVADPGLPSELLPDDWPRQRARTRFVGRYAELAGLAEQRMREHVADVDEDLSALIAHRVFAA